MTAPDVRTAAQAEAERRHRLNPDHMRARVFFVDGAVWGAALVTPTREQLVAVLKSKLEREMPWLVESPVVFADAVLALMQGESRT